MAASKVEMRYIAEPLKCVKKTELWHTFGCALWREREKKKPTEISSSYFMFSLMFAWGGHCARKHSRE